MEDHPLVLIVDDDGDFRRVISAFLRSDGIPSREYASIEDLIPDFDAQVAGCILLDLSFPQSSGLALQEWLLRQGSTTPVVYLSGSATVPEAVRALKLGAIEFLEKPVGKEILIATTRAALEECVRRRAIERETAEVRSRLADLTTRESEVARKLLEGLSSKEIAKALGVSSRTIDHQRSAVLRKMHASNAADLARKIALAENCRSGPG